MTVPARLQTAKSDPNPAYDPHAEAFGSWLRQRIGRVTALSLLCATLLASLYMWQDHRTAVIQGKALDDPWDLARQRYLIWWLWALLTPAYLLLGERFRVRGRATLHRLPFWIAAGFLVGVVHGTLFLVLARAIGWLPPLAIEPVPLPVAIWHRALAGVGSNLLVLSVVALALHAVAYAYEFGAAARNEALLEARLARSELERLKLQLQPHFVFNTLQTVSALMPTNVEGARRVLALLGELLRHSLDSLGVHEVPLRDEVTVLRKYVEIQRTRFPERLQVDIAVDPAGLDLMVPSFLLQPIVENAIRHGIEARSTGGKVEISALREGDHLRVTVRDDGVGLSPGSLVVSNEGVGLPNTRARLTHLYGSDYQLELNARLGGGTEVLIEIPAGAT